MSDLIEAAKAVHPDNVETALDLLKHLAGEENGVCSVYVTAGEITNIGGNTTAHNPDGSPTIVPLLQEAAYLALSAES